MVLRSFSENCHTFGLLPGSEQHWVLYLLFWHVSVLIIQRRIIIPPKIEFLTTIFLDILIPLAWAGITGVSIYFLRNYKIQMRLIPASSQNELISLKTRKWDPAGVMEWRCQMRAWYGSVCFQLQSCGSFLTYAHFATSHGSQCRQVLLQLSAVISLWLGGK